MCELVSLRALEDADEREAIEETVQRLVEALEASEMIEADEARSMQVSPDPPPTLLHTHTSPHTFVSMPRLPPPA